MEENDEKMTISFKLENGGEVYSASSEIYMFPYDCTTPLQNLGKQFDNFLRQAGYFRKYDTIFMESITEEEYDFLEKALQDYRKENKDG